MARPLTASSIRRARHCPASYALTWVEEPNQFSTHGTNVHAFLEMCNRGGVGHALANAQAAFRLLENAKVAGITDIPTLDKLNEDNLYGWTEYENLRQKILKKVPAQSITVCEAVDLEKVPLGQNFIPEAAFAFDIDTGFSAYLGSGLGRRYKSKFENPIYGTADIATLLGGEDGDRVYIGDYKSGGGGHDSYTPPAADNDQLKFLAMAACGAWGRTGAVVEIIHVSQSGAIWKDRAEFDTFELDDFKLELKRTVESIPAAAVEPRTFHAGVWCRYCPAHRFCPAKVESLKIINEALLGKRSVGPLESNNAENAWRWTKSAAQTLQIITTDVENYLAEHPVTLEDGSILGLVEKERAYFDGEVTKSVLQDVVGDDLAEKGVDISASRESVKRALRIHIQRHQGEKLGLGKLLDEVKAEVDKRGGLATRTFQSIEPHKPSTDDEVPA